MTETAFNAYPIIDILIKFLAVSGGLFIVNNVFNLISRGFKDKLDNKKDIHFKDKDAEITQKIIEYQNKYPDVDLQYILKPDSEKAIENCQELHEQNQKIDAINNKLATIDYYIKQLNIHQSMSLAENKNILSKN